MRVHIKRKRESVGLVLAVSDGLFFGLTDPARAPSTFFIVAFILLGTSFYLCLHALLRGMSLKHAKRVAAAITGGICTLLALQSVGQLTTRDIIVFVPLAALAYFYVSYSRRQHASQ